jgi:lipoate---protein ligase
LITREMAWRNTCCGPGLVPVNEAATFDPVVNLERETRCLEAVLMPSFRVWRSTDSVVLGKFLKAEDEVHLARARKMEVPVLHRPSGGGAVFHDLGNVNYSIYLPHNNAPAYSIEESLRLLSFPVMILLDSLGVPWSWVPPNNIYIQGKKISGSAQARSRGVLLHHGTLLVVSDLAKMSQLLKPGGRSRIAPVENLSEVVSNITAEKAEALLIEILTKQRQPERFDFAYAK